MSARAALLLALVLLVVLGAVGAFLVAVPFWAVVSATLGLLGLLYFAFARRRRREALRQNTEG